MTRKQMSSRRGSGLVEFSLVAVQLFLVVFAAMEFSRMVLVYSAIANSARVAARYAIVHGSDRSASATASDVCGVATGYARGALINTGALTCGATSGSRITVAWPDGNTKPGSRVQVAVVYQYDPFFALPLNVNLGSTTEEYIMY